MWDVINFEADFRYFTKMPFTGANSYARQFFTADYASGADLYNV